MAEQDHKWVSSALFKWSYKRKPQLDGTRLDRIWFHPPPAPRGPLLTRLPEPDLYFTHKLCLWMPKKIWKYSFRCPKEACKGSNLISAGLYRNVRRVLDIDQFYYLAGEYLQCPSCTCKLISWSLPLLRQMDSSFRSEFPAILTYHLACDIKVVRFMRPRSKGNSPMQLLRSLEEQHTEDYMNRVLQYLEDYRRFFSAMESGVVPAYPACQPPPMDKMPTYHWLQSVYVKDVCERLDDTQAAITSVYGSILKLDSTKKVVKKLQGHSAGTASWATNVGNEHGQVLMSVLTTHRGSGLRDMFLGLQSRYHGAGVPPPKVLYVNRDCCNGSMQRMLQPHWSATAVRLDIWYYMRRFAAAVTTESHPLYPSFMSRLSKAIFVWNDGDYKKLVEARRAQLQEQGFLHPSHSDVLNRISPNNLALHCRRTTRGMEEMKRLIKELLEVYTSEQAKDTLGVPVLDKEHAWQVWSEQQCHLPCIQDPPDVSLYTQTGTINKDSISLPTFRCARGLTSLENFHLHLNHFIPGNSTSHLHYQAYLVEGLMRWNQDRAAAAMMNGTAERPRTYNNKLLQCINERSAKVLGQPLFPWFKAPQPYTGEKIGYDYLLSQNAECLMERQDRVLEPDLEPSVEMEAQVPGEGLEEADSEEVDDTIFSVSDELLEDFPGHALVEHNQPSTSACDESERPSVSKETSPEETVSPEGASGYHHVQALVQLLLPLRHKMAVSNGEAQEIIQACNSLDDCDKRPLKLREWLPSKIEGWYKAQGRTVSSGAMVNRRCRWRSRRRPAVRVDCSRLLEGVLRELCVFHPSPATVEGRRMNRWALVLRDYARIRSLLFDCPLVLDNTFLQLPDINQTTLRDWSKRKVKDEEKVPEHDLPHRRLAEPADQPVVPATTPLPSTSGVCGAGNDPHTLQRPPGMAGWVPSKQQPVPIPVVLVVPSAVVSTAQLRTLAVPVALQPGSLAVSGSVQSPSAPIPSRGVSRSTLYYRKRQLARQKAGQNVRINRRHVAIYTCRKCAKPRFPEVDGQLAHSQVKGAWWCREVDIPLQEWTEQRKAVLAALKRSQASEPGCPSKQRKILPVATITSSEAATSALSDM